MSARCAAPACRAPRPTDRHRNETRCLESPAGCAGSRDPPSGSIADAEQCDRAQADGVLRSACHENGARLAAESAIGRQIGGDLLAQRTAAPRIAIAEPRLIGMGRLPTQSRPELSEQHSVRMGVAEGERPSNSRLPTIRALNRRRLWSRRQDRRDIGARRRFWSRRSHRSAGAHRR